MVRASANYWAPFQAKRLVSLIAESLTGKPQLTSGQSWRKDSATSCAVSCRHTPKDLLDDSAIRSFGVCRQLTPKDLMALSSNRSFGVCRQLTAKDLLDDSAIGNGFQ